MVFTSIEFISLFLPVTIIVYFLINTYFGLKGANLVLLIFSLFFMFVGSAKDILVLLSIVIICYLSGLLMSFTQNKGKRTAKTILLITIILTIGTLGYYKYASFFAENITVMTALFGISIDLPKAVYKIMLPLGISFYTFQALSYVFDVYNKKVKTTYNLLDFALYVSFFPQIIAGPIVRYIDIYEQIKSRTSTVNDVYIGFIRFIRGAIKKVLLANIVATVADAIFKLPINHLNSGLAWVGIITYTLQIYLDFSAYSDMAIGLARIFGFKLFENFNLPYVSKSIQEFWRRWHLSLSSWFRDYLYFPLGGNKKGNIRTYINLIVVFLVCGLWHGADWVFIIWGIWHGLFLIIERLFLGKWLKKTPAFVARLYTLLAVMFGWVLFRSTTLHNALGYMKRLIIPMSSESSINRNIFEFLQNDAIIAAVFGIAVSAGLFKKLYDYAMKRKVTEVVYVMILLALFFLSMTSLYSGSYNPFIYFRF